VGLSEGLGAAYLGESCWRCREGGGSGMEGLQAKQAKQAKHQCIASAGYTYTDAWRWLSTDCVSHGEGSRVGEERG